MPDDLVLRKELRIARFFPEPFRSSDQDDAAAGLGDEEEVGHLEGKADDDAPPEDPLEALRFGNVGAGDRREQDEDLSGQAPAVDSPRAFDVLRQEEVRDERAGVKEGRGEEAAKEAADDQRLVVGCDCAGDDEEIADAETEAKHPFPAVVFAEWRYADGPKGEPDEEGCLALASRYSSSVGKDETYDPCDQRALFRALNMLIDLQTTHNTVSLRNHIVSGCVDWGKCEISGGSER
jgi:hypothetical protein